MATRTYSNNKYLLERLLSACDTIAKLQPCGRQRPPPPLLLTFPPWPKGSEEPWGPWNPEQSRESTPESTPEPDEAQPEFPRSLQYVLSVLAIIILVCVMFLLSMLEGASHVQPRSTQYVAPTIRSMNFPLARYTGYIQSAQESADALVTVQLTNVFWTELGLPAEIVFDTGATVSTAEKSWLLKHCPVCQPMTLEVPMKLQGVSGAMTKVTEFAYVDLVFSAQTKDGSAELRVAAMLRLVENSNVDMLLGMDIAHLHKIDVDQRRKKLIFREAGDAEVDFHTGTGFTD
ncbi:hypothetical protein LTR70_009854 [Exophiala xenobiotica]|uniref:Peptidase A2 domain-containing protein n=1 Tax=Lithohypha guttulata TaxID=1690604 RepID=A0ABR0KDA9_9EURO|nr:hypothetical protein LTR24_004046 [Lithohypha guttulata]KAK5309951.1 hypothetical protein LTR70_009854 [Exophiala xenobiotica]